MNRNYPTPWQLMAHYAPGPVMYAANSLYNAGADTYRHIVKPLAKGYYAYRALDAVEQGVKKYMGYPQYAKGTHFGRGGQQLYKKKLKRRYIKKYKKRYIRK